jgi:hypothetical protein
LEKLLRYQLSFDFGWTLVLAVQHDRLGNQLDKLGEDLLISLPQNYVVGDRDNGLSSATPIRK